MSINTMTWQSERLPRSWETLGSYIERVLVGPQYNPTYHADRPAKRIGWLDSVRSPSRIHATQDDGETTICGHRPLDKTREENPFGEEGRPTWVIVAEVPRKMRGRSRYCKTCFGFVDKTVPWLEPEALDKKNEEVSRT